MCIRDRVKIPLSLSLSPPTPICSIFYIRALPRFQVSNIQRCRGLVDFFWLWVVNSTVWCGIFVWIIRWTRLKTAAYFRCRLWLNAWLPQFLPFRRVFFFLSPTTKLVIWKNPFQFMCVHMQVLIRFNLSVVLEI